MEKLNLNLLKQVFLDEGQTVDYANEAVHSSVGLAYAIMMVAHQGQKRVNGDDYYTHPFGARNSFCDFVRIDRSDFDIDDLYKVGIPFDGVQEVCLLHDVIEDTTVTMDEIESLFKDVFLDDYFNLYIKKPLMLVTHQKDEPYESYVEKLMVDPIASMVKMMDLHSNTNLLTLDKFSMKEYKRCQDYLHYFYIINNKWHYLEKVHKLLNQ